MLLHSLKNLKTFSCMVLTAALTLTTSINTAEANIIHSEVVGISGAKIDQARLILDRASYLAFQGASAVQKLQSLSVTPSTSAILKDYMASMIYIPQAMALPSDADILEEETMVHPGQYKDGPMEDEPVDAHALEFGDSPSLDNKVLKFLKPVQNAFISSPFGFRWGRPHQGIDMAAPSGTPIVAAEGGKVVFSGWKQGYGSFVALDHGYGYVTHYAHCSKILVKVGDKVKKGQLIAKVGNTGRSTGPHLHFEVVAKGVHQNPSKFIDNKLTVGQAK